MSKDFQRRDSVRYLKLGKKKRKVPWRKPKGRDNKMRLSMSGYPKTVSVGYKTPKIQAGKIDNLTPILVHNLNEIDNLPKDSIAIIARVGAKKKLTLIKSLNEKKIRILNLKVDKK